MQNLPKWTAAFPSLQGLQGEAARLLERGELATFPKGAVLFEPGQACRAYLLVVRGSVRVSHSGEGGREVVLYRVEPGESCILTTSCLLSGRNYASEAVAETEVEAVLFSRPDFEALLSLSAEFRDLVFSVFGERLLDLLLLIDGLAFQRVDERLARLLVQRMGPENQVEGTHRQLAEELGTAREVVSRRLKAFEERGLVRLRRGGIEILDLGGLRGVYGYRRR